MTKVVVVDPGHTEEDDRYFAGSDYEQREGVNNFLTAKLIKDYLESKYDVKVILTRNKVSDAPSLTIRGALAKGADLFYSLHSNASEDATVRGVEVWYNQNSAKAIQFANSLSAVLASFMGNMDRNKYEKKGADNPATAKREGLAVINSAINAGCPVAVLAEVGFHDNKIDAGILIDKRVELAELQAKQIAKFLNLEVKMEKPKLDVAQKWAVDNGIAADRNWDEPLTKHTLVWLMMDFWRKLSEGAIK